MPHFDLPLDQLRTYAPAIAAPADFSDFWRATLAAVGEMAAAWSMVHGFAVLAIDGRLAPFLTRAPQGADIDDLFDAALARLDVGVRAKE